MLPTAFPTSDWQVVHNPTTATQATCTKAADSTPTSPPASNFKPQLIVNAITASIATGGTAQTPIHVHLRDGTTGAGTIIWSAIMSSPVAGCSALTQVDLNIPITSGNATLEFEGAGVTASQQSVAMSGYMRGYGG